MGAEMKLERCVCCLGRKTLIGLGNILVKCNQCKGIGYVDAPKMDDSVDDEPAAKPVKRVRSKPVPKAPETKKPYVLKDI